MSKRTETITPANPGFNLLQLYLGEPHEKTDDEVRHSMTATPIISWLHVSDGEGGIDVTPLAVECVSNWDDPRYVIGIEYSDGQVLIPDDGQCRNHAEFIEYVLSKRRAQMNAEIAELYAGSDKGNSAQVGAR